MAEVVKITGQPQAEIRQAIKALDEEMKTVTTNLTEARTAFELCQSTYLTRLLEIRNRCKHTNATLTAITKTCNDCGVFGVTGV